LGGSCWRKNGWDLPSEINGGPISSLPKGFGSFLQGTRARASEGSSVYGPPALYEHMGGDPSIKYTCRCIPVHDWIKKTAEKYCRNGTTVWAKSLTQSSSKMTSSGRSSGLGAPPASREPVTKNKQKRKQPKKAKLQKHKKRKIGSRLLPPKSSVHRGSKKKGQQSGFQLRSMGR